MTPDLKSPDGIAGELRETADAFPDWLAHVANDAISPTLLAVSVERFPALLIEAAEAIQTLRAKLGDAATTLKGIGYVSAGDNDRERCKSLARDCLARLGGEFSPVTREAEPRLVSPTDGQVGATDREVAP